MQDSTCLMVDYIRAIYMRSSLYNLKPLTTQQEAMATEITNPIFLGIIQDMNRQMQPRAKVTTKKYSVCEAPKVSEEELEARRTKWQPREPKVTSGYLARYASMVTSGNRGAVLEIPR